MRKLSQGVDFLGYVVLSGYRVLRTKTKRRMFKKMDHRLEDFREGKISDKTFQASRQSYLGMLKHCEGKKIGKVFIEKFPSVCENLTPEL